MQNRILIIVIIFGIVLAISLISISLYFFSGGNLSKLSDEELYKLLDDNINLRSQITGNKLLVKRCIKQFNKRANGDAEIYIEDNIVYITDGIQDIKYRELTKKMEIVDEQLKQIEIEYEEIDKSNLYN